MLVSYDGSLFQGWQIQPHGETVQGRLTQAIAQITQRPAQVYGSGRTDAGVHALNQVAHVDVPRRLPLAGLLRGINALAAPGVVVKRLVPVPATFHARHAARSKVYRYQIFNRPYPSALAPLRCWWLRKPLHLPTMRKAAQHLLGEHDFSAFRSRECAAASPVRRMLSIDITPVDWPEATLCLTFHATGFLQHMARILTGTLVAAGQHRLTAGTIAGVLESRDRTQAGMTAPGQGLHLVRVHYDKARFPMLVALRQAVSDNLQETRPLD